MRRLIPEAEGITPLDWHAFNVSAAYVIQTLMKREGGSGSGSGSGSGADTGETQPGAQRGRRRNGPVMRDNEGTQQLHIRGTEVPPWER